MQVSEVKTEIPTSNIFLSVMKCDCLEWQLLKSEMVFERKNKLPVETCSVCVCLFLGMLTFEGRDLTNSTD